MSPSWTWVSRSIEIERPRKATGFDSHSGLWVGRRRTVLFETVSRSWRRFEQAPNYFKRQRGAALRIQQDVSWSDTFASSSGSRCSVLSILSSSRNHQMFLLRFHSWKGHEFRNRPLCWQTSTRTIVKIRWSLTTGAQSRAAHNSINSSLQRGSRSASRRAEHFSAGDQRNASPLGT